LVPSQITTPDSVTTGFVEMEGIVALAKGLLAHLNGGTVHSCRHHQRPFR
jgi:hypothetical protein